MAGYLFQLLVSALFYPSSTNRFQGRLEGLIFYLAWPGWILGFRISGDVDASRVWTGVVMRFLLNGAMTSILIYGSIVIFTKGRDLL